MQKWFFSMSSLRLLSSKLLVNKFGFKMICYTITKTLLLSCCFVLSLCYIFQTISLTFHSSVIEDAGPPTCDISWNGTYLVPKKPTNESTGRPDADLLPSCFIMDSREGYHMTYYWFHLLEWQFG